LAPVDEASRATAKVMFEVYREGGYDRRYRVVYFTELDDHNRDAELNRCLAGETFLSGYLSEASRKDSRVIIRDALKRLNDGEDLTPAALEAELSAHMV
jgi:hypothetical protein